jgi:hypothetical protein
MAIFCMLTRWQEKEGFLFANNPKAIFYADVSEPLASEVSASLKGISLKVMTEKTPPVFYNDASFNGRRAYIRCAQDQVLDPPIQDALLEGSGVEWIVKEMSGGHSPFLYAPEKTAAIFTELVNQFAAVA